jgi:hypothetical protein
MAAVGEGLDTLTWCTILLCTDLRVQAARVPAADSKGWREADYGR